MDADGRMGRAGAAGDDADARATGELAVRLGHVRGGRLVPAGDQPDRCVVEPVEDVEETLARDAVGKLGAVHDELVDEQLAAPAGRLPLHSSCSR